MNEMEKTVFAVTRLDAKINREGAKRSYLGYMSAYCFCRTNNACLESRWYGILWELCGALRKEKEQGKYARESNNFCVSLLLLGRIGEPSPHVKMMY